MNAQEIRNSYIKFFAERQHTHIPRALLVPQNDPTTLFTGSGMQPLIPYLLGEPHPGGTRLVDSQTSLRAQDIEEVGDNRHTTFFEMLGNWSLGDYNKTDQIKWMFEFLTDVVGIDPERLYVTCFIGAPQFGIPKDVEAAGVWQQLFTAKNVTAEIADIDSEGDGYARGIKPGERIFYYDGSKNWWNRGKTGPETTPVGDPCGPDSEMFFDFGTPHDPKWGEQCHPNCDCGRFMEIGNNVFMAYRKIAEGQFEPLEKPNIDHGSGLERIAAAAIDNPDVFRISLLWPVIAKLEELSGKSYDSNQQSMRVIADHLRAATFLAVDGVVPSNKTQGYVMRRLMRRAIRFAFDLGIEQNFMPEVVPVIADLYKDDLPEVAASRDKVIDILIKEEKAFRQTLRKGLKEFDALMAMKQSIRKFNDRIETGAHDYNEVEAFNEEYHPVIEGKDAFRLYDTYGFPLELTLEEAYRRNIIPSQYFHNDYQAAIDEQRQRSRTAAKGTFKGGLGGQKDIHKKYHTATHLMYQSLRTVLGDHIIQHGSNITEERLRFDFSHDEKMTPEQISRVEAMVNEQIAKDLVVTFEEHPTDYAINELHVLGAFGDRYGDIVKCYRMQAAGEDTPFSFEICGGPHVEHTAQLAEDGKRFKITKEESSSAGIRRIKAILQ